MVGDEPAKHGADGKQGKSLFSLSEERLAALRAGSSIDSPEEVNGRMTMEAGKVAQIFHDSDSIDGGRLRDQIKHRGTAPDSGEGT